jgi:YesN/AraC family two-component response regulator
MDVISADNGINALLKLGQTPPDIVITDLNMPLMDGFQMLRMMLQSIRSQKSHFIVITGLPLDEVRQQGSLPVDVTLMGKPVDFDKLEKTVRDKVDELSI